MSRSVLRTSEFPAFCTKSLAWIRIILSYFKNKKLILYSFKFRIFEYCNKKGKRRTLNIVVGMFSFPVILIFWFVILTFRISELSRTYGQTANGLSSDLESKRPLFVIFGRFYKFDKRRLTSSQSVHIIMEISRKSCFEINKKNLRFYQKSQSANFRRNWRIYGAKEKLRFLHKYLNLRDEFDFER